MKKSWDWIICEVLYFMVGKLDQAIVKISRDVVIGMMNQYFIIG